jgi:hypothetical protein
MAIAGFLESDTFRAIVHLKRQRREHPESIIAKIVRGPNKCD